MIEPPCGTTLKPLDGGVRDASAQAVSLRCWDGTRTAATGAAALTHRPTGEGSIAWHTADGSAQSAQTAASSNSKLYVTYHASAKMWTNRSTEGVLADGSCRQVALAPCRAERIGADNGDRIGA